MVTLITIVFAGALAQLIDGGIGMGFGVTSTTVLVLLAGLGPAQASAVVHTAELGTTLVSGLSHWRFGNVDWKTVLKLGVPGAIGAFCGATFLSAISLHAAQPVTATILCLIGMNLVWRFSKGRRQRTFREQPYRPSVLVGLGFFGGFIDASGGGGWGPVTTGTLLSIDQRDPRRVIGTVNTAEFLVAFAATAGFVVGLWPELVSNLAAMVALLLGGILTTPIAAWIVSRVNPIALGGFVGAALVAMNLPRALYFVHIPWWIQALVLLSGVIAAAYGIRRSRKQHRTQTIIHDPEATALRV